MKLFRLFLTLMIAGCLFFTSGVADAEDGSFDTSLPMTVRIIDFESTRQICGSNQPPPWCPAHLLRQADQTANESHSSLLSLTNLQGDAGAGMTPEEFAKRERIGKAKAKLGYRQMSRNKM